MKKYKGFLFLLICFLYAGAAFSKCLNCIWSADFSPLYNPNQENPPLSITSPDKKHTVTNQDNALFFISTGNEETLSTYVSPGLIEMSWAKDSKSFAINYSDGSYVGSWNVDYYVIKPNNHLKRIDITGKAKTLSKEFAQCDEPEELNFALLTWLQPQEAILVAEVPPHSTCKNMGALQGFRMNLSKVEILEVYDEETLREKWNDVLGKRLSVSKVN